MAQIEPMDIDNVGSDFDDKENSLQNSNYLPRTPCTEKGYEELDVSELNMKLRYSITPASSPMSKSYTASCKDNKNYSFDDDSLNNTMVNNNANLTRSLNSSITKCDVISKSPKLPLQTLPTDKYVEINSSVRRSLENDPSDITITVDGIDNIDENLSLPSTSSSTIQTPEATTPTKDNPKGDGGSPIMRGLKSVLNMFRSSQSPIPPEDIDKIDNDTHSAEETDLIPQEVMASTPKANIKNNDNNSSKRSSPLKDSVVFNDDLERELQWKDETTIIFKQEKIPIHKLFLQQSTSQALDKKISTTTNDQQKLNTTVEYMDISYNESGIIEKTTEVEDKISGNIVETTSGVESDGEFLDCETTYTKYEQTDLKQQCSIIPTNTEINDLTREITEDNINIHQINNVVTVGVIKDSDIQTINVSSVKADDVEIQEAKCETGVKECHELDSNVQTELEHVDTIINKDMNVTTVLHTSVDAKVESNSDPINIQQPDISLNQNFIENVENETNNENQHELLCSSINNQAIDQLDEKQNFDATILLNVETDFQEDVLLNKSNESNNFIFVNKENIELDENKTPSLNSGILQICEKLCDNTEHEHVNNNTLDIKSDLENNTDVKNVVIDNVNSDELLPINLTNLVVNICDKNEKLDSFDQNIQKIYENTHKIEYNNAEVSPLNQHEIGIEAQNNDKINDLENNLNNIVNDINHLPSDIPLPSDDDIEKDSLMDNLVSKHDDIDNDNNFDSITECKINDFECMDQVSEGNVNANIESSKDLTTLVKSSTSLSYHLSITNSDEILATENAINPTNFESITVIDNIEINQESTHEGLPKNEFNTSDQELLKNEIQCPNNIDIINNQTIDDIVCVASCRDLQSIKVNNEDIEDTELENKDSLLKEDGVKILNDIVGVKDNKSFDEEILTSANNSPYVSVNEFDLNIPKYDINLDDIESPFETKSKIASSPPISPKLPQKGYNINFDEIDDPFATKTNIRMSPPLETTLNSSSVLLNTTQKKIDIKKRVQPQNRRKSQPERGKIDVTKKRFNSSYNVDTRNSICKKQIETSLHHDDNIDVVDKNHINNSNCTTTMLGLDTTKSLDANASAVDNSNTPNEGILHSEETFNVQEEIRPFNVEPTVSNYSPKNVFNLPEIDDMNFNPFATKSKMCTSPTPSFDVENTLMEEETTRVDFHTSEMILQRESLASNLEKETQENKIQTSDVSSETCSSKNTDKDLTVREIHTEDEDTIEGPFLEVEESADVVKVSDFATETDMMQFEDLHTEINNENKEEGELFIDAEAFEFLLNQNKCNVVADSGKESLFLKFDPLFAKRVSSDGVLAALNRIQKRQSTPKKTLETSNQNKVTVEEKPPASVSTVGTVFEENNDDTIMFTKPMMVVNPAINSLVSPRKSITPPRINRRSLTFTSPAMAVIDRLLSLSGNSSNLEQDPTSPRANREYNETDIALTQLRELLAEKEIHVHNLRSESKELKERLATMESQVKTLEKETEERLKKVNDLNERLSEKTKINKSMAIVVEEYERTIASLIAEMEQEKRRNADERTRLISERDEQTAHLASMEVSFSDLHSKYEKSKQIILSMKANEDTYRKSIKEFEVNLLKMQNNYELLKQHATSKLNHANQELEKFNRAHESEVLKLNAMIKRKELHITSLEESLAQKTKANEELTAICDELINKVG